MTGLNVGILGAGVIGLTTALELQSELPNADITIYAEKFDQSTTSNVAAGIFRPGTSFSTHSEELTRRIIADSYAYYDRLRLCDSALSAGISEISGYIFSSTKASLVRNELFETVVPVYRRATEEELRLCPGKWKFGSYFTTILTECSSFLPWCMNKFRQGLGRVVEMKISKLKDMENEKLDVIVNCMGLGAKYVCKDRKIVPIRGQVLKVEAPWLENFFYADYDTYIIPGQKLATLGGCRNYDSYDERVSRHDTSAIWERCTALVPRLEACTIREVRVGLRPHRDPVRMEREHIRTEAGTLLKVVHNYGHGGYGVTTAPGSAKYAVSLVKQSLIGKNKI